MFREFDVVTLRVPIETHPAGTIVDLDGEVAIVEFPSDDDLDVVGVSTADLAPMTVDGSRSCAA